MQRIFIKDHFDHYFSLFKLKYSYLLEYLGYFESHWISGKFQNWHYFNRESNVFLTNNLCEVFDSDIKREITLREKPDMISILNSFMDFFRNKKNENLKMSDTINLEDYILVHANEVNTKNIFVINRGMFIIF
jgi:hypothetical protein